MSNPTAAALTFSLYMYYSNDNGVHSPTYLVPFSNVDIHSENTTYVFYGYVNDWPAGFSTIAFNISGTGNVGAHIKIYAIGRGTRRHLADAA